MSNDDKDLEARLEAHAQAAEKAANNAKKFSGQAAQSKKDAQAAEKAAVEARSAALQAQEGAQAAREAAERARDEVGKARDEVGKARDEVGKARTEVLAARDDVMAAKARPMESSTSMHALGWALVDTIAMVARTDADDAIHEAADAVMRAARATDPVLAARGGAREGYEHVLTLASRFSADQELERLEAKARQLLDHAELEAEAAAGALAAARARQQAAGSKRAALDELVESRLAERGSEPHVGELRTELLGARQEVVAEALGAEESSAQAEESARRAGDALEQLQEIVREAAVLHPVSREVPINTRDDIRSLFFGRLGEAGAPSVAAPATDEAPTTPGSSTAPAGSSAPSEGAEGSPEPSDEPAAVEQPQPWYWWQPVDARGIPSGALVAGEFSERGEPFFAARIEHRGGVHMGKVWGQFGEAHVPYGGVDVVTRKYAVLMARREAPLSWVPAAGGHVPKGAVQGGHESNGAALYVARAPYGGDGTHPGKVRPGFGGANIPWGGKEVRVDPYEVLVFDAARAAELERGEPTPAVDEGPAPIMAER
ncbi:MAG: DUF3421 domain-containing protein, partial [Myxococcales bacterium]|nr:DUF3421 domain-containing protein [Myxococcales bacterium]